MGAIEPIEIFPVPPILPIGIDEGLLLASIEIREVLSIVSTSILGFVPTDDWNCTYKFLLTTN